MSAFEIQSWVDGRWSADGRGTTFASYGAALDFVRDDLELSADDEVEAVVCGEPPRGETPEQEWWRIVEVTS